MSLGGGENSEKMREGVSNRRKTWVYEVWSKMEPELGDQGDEPYEKGLRSLSTEEERDVKS